MMEEIIPMFARVSLRSCILQDEGYYEEEDYRDCIDKYGLWQGVLAIELDKKIDKNVFDTIVITIMDDDYSGYDEYSYSLNMIDVVDTSDLWRLIEKKWGANFEEYKRVTPNLEDDE